MKVIGLVFLFQLLVSSFGLRVRSASGRGCPLCEDFSKCLEACREHREEKEDSRFCLNKCGESHPWNPIRSGFDGPEPPTPEQAAHAWYDKMMKLLS
mmetsp:Transcript_90135/g.160529  ORF Transcript_90135/g.160529 Transcript_90135/m.160529 type:complete len:97 (+) Transcript_90135:67-357(+)